MGTLVTKVILSKPDLSPKDSLFKHSKQTCLNCSGGRQQLHMWHTCKTSHVPQTPNQQVCAHNKNHTWPSTKPLHSEARGTVQPESAMQVRHMQVSTTASMLGGQLSKHSSTVGKQSLLHTYVRTAQLISAAAALNCCKPSHHYQQNPQRNTATAKHSSNDKPSSSTHRP